MSTLAIEGVRLRYRLLGPESAAGPPLLFVHGAAGGQYVWLEQAEGLKEDHRLLLMDLAGHGASEPCAPPADVPGHARMLSGLIDALGLPPCLVVGHSMGGAIVMSLALEAPSRVAGLVLMATGARLPVSPAVFQAIDAGLEGFGTLLAQVAYSPRTSRDLVARFTGAPIQCTQEVVRADFEACQAYDLRERLGEIAGLPQAQLQWIPAAGHMVMQEAPEAVNGAIRAFAAQLRTSS